MYSMVKKGKDFEVPSTSQVRFRIRKDAGDVQHDGRKFAKEGRR